MMAQMREQSQALAAALLALQGPAAVPVPVPAPVHNDLPPPPPPLVGQVQPTGNLDRLRLSVANAAANGGIPGYKDEKDTDCIHPNGS